MTAVDLAPQPSRATPALPRITGRLDKALRLMIEEGMTYQDAAKAVGMHVRQMRKAIEKPHILNHLKRKRLVFRATICASNDLRLAAVRDTSGNAMAIVQAVKALEQLGDDQQHQRHSSAFSSSPGLVIVVNGNASISEQHAKPLIDNDITD